METNENESTPIWRVKLYELEHTGTWVDHGIGHATVEMVNDLNGPALCVASESEQGKYLMRSKIQSEDLYERQGTIILWKEADFSGTIDYALSFQDPEGFNTIWNSINEVQGQYLQQREYGNVPSFARSHRISQNDSDNSSFTVLDENDASNNIYSILPTDIQSEDWLCQIKTKLGLLHPSQRDYVVAQLMHDDYAYFKSLFNKFAVLEQDNDQLSLQLLAEIFRLILLLNDSSTVEFLLMNDEVFRNVAGIFEYDHTLREQGQYRRFLFETARMKEVVNLSEDLSVACRFLFRLKYVRDVMLHPTIDDPGITAINSMITFTSCEICSQIMLGKEYIAEAFFRISPKFKHGSYLSNDHVDKQLCIQSIDAVMFLKELFILSKFMAVEKRYELYRQFFDEFYNLFVEVVEFLVAGGCRALYFGSEQFSLARSATVSSDPNGLDIGATGTETPSTMIDTIDRSFSFRSDVSDDLPMPQPLPHPVPVNTETLTSTVPIQKSVFEECFTYEEAMDMLQALGEILSAVACTYPSILRQAIIGGVHPPWNPMRTNSSSVLTERWEESSVLFCLIFCILHGQEVITIESFGDVVKTLLDFEKVTLNAKNEKEKFLPVFYDNYLPWLLLPFLEDHNPAKSIPLSFYSMNNIFQTIKGRNENFGNSMFPPGFSSPRAGLNSLYSSNISPVATEQSGFVIATSRRVILDIMMYCIAYHSYRLKYFMLRGNILPKILQKSFPKHSTVVSGDSSCHFGKCCRHIQLYAMKLLKTVLCTKDDFYFRHIEKMDLFSYLFSAFFSVSSNTTSERTKKSVCLLKDNILTSNFYDIIDYVQKEDINLLIIHLNKKFGTLYGNADLQNYVDCFDKLTVKYEQLLDRQSTHQVSSSANNNTIDLGNGRRGWLNVHSPKWNGKDAQRLQEAEVEDDYFFGNDDIDNNSDISNKRRKSDDGRPTPVSSLPNLFKIHTTGISTKPSSPPHYSQRKHGSPLDGELTSANNNNSNNNLSCTYHSPHFNQQLHDDFDSPQQDLFSLLADYKDEDQGNDSNGSSPSSGTSDTSILSTIATIDGDERIGLDSANDEEFPLLPPRIQEDEDDVVATVFCGKKNPGLPYRKAVPINNRSTERIMDQSSGNDILHHAARSENTNYHQPKPSQLNTIKNDGWEEQNVNGSNESGVHHPITLVLKRKPPSTYRYH